MGGSGRSHGDEQQKGKERDQKPRRGEEHFHRLIIPLCARGSGSGALFTEDPNIPGIIYNQPAQDESSGQDGMSTCSMPSRLDQRLLG